MREVKAYLHVFLTFNVSGFDGLEVACWPLVLKFAGSNPTESSTHLPSEK
jgi:hypothetical protein